VGGISYRMSTLDGIALRLSAAYEDRSPFGVSRLSNHDRLRHAIFDILIRALATWFWLLCSSSSVIVT
jgi:hypothetical protein